MRPTANILSDSYEDFSTRRRKDVLGFDNTVQDNPQVLGHKDLAARAEFQCAQQHMQGFFSLEAYDLH